VAERPVTLEILDEEIAASLPRALMPSVAQLEARIRELEHLLATQMRSDDLQVESGVSARTGEPFMHMRWGDQAGQLTPQEARQHALRILDAAAASEFDAALVRALVGEMGVPHEKAVRFLGVMREQRGGTDQASAVETGPQPERGHG
jgi:hypothetical protein